MDVGYGGEFVPQMILQICSRHNATTARPVKTQYRTCSVKNLVHLEISDKFSVFYRIIDFYAFLHTVAKRDLICRPIVYVYFILCMIARPKRFIKPKIMLMKSKLKTILIFVFQQIHFVFGQFLTAVLASRIVSSMILDAV